MIRNPIDELEPIIRRLAAESGLGVDERALAEARRFTGTPINLPRMVGDAIVAGLREAAETYAEREYVEPGDEHEYDHCGVRIAGYYDVETLGRAALRALGVGGG